MMQLLPLGYVLHSNGKRISVTTDFCIYTQEIKDNINDSIFYYLKAIMM